MRLHVLTLALALGGPQAALRGQDAAAWTAHLGAAFRVVNDVTYLTASNRTDSTPRRSWSRGILPAGTWRFTA